MNRRQRRRREKFIRHPAEVVDSSRGHLIVSAKRSGRPAFDGRRWADSGEKFDVGLSGWVERDCAFCGRPPTPEGDDACIAALPGVRAACCGHGIPVASPSVHEAYVLFEDGRRLGGSEARDAMRALGGDPPEPST